jgi:hypothetical protein
MSRTGENRARRISQCEGSIDSKCGMGAAPRHSGKDESSDSRPEMPTQVARVDTSRTGRYPNFTIEGV